MSTGFNSKSQRHQPLLTLAFEALKPGTDLSSPVMKVLDGIVFQSQAVSSTLKNLLVRVATLVSAPGRPG